jgi:enoyl-CoA hydratase
MEFETIILKKNNGIATIVYNRPNIMNAYNEQMSREMKISVKDVAEDESVRVLVIKGAGDNFMVGADINMLGSYAKTAEEEGLEAAKQRILNHFRTMDLEKLAKPVIAAVDGMAWGMGCEMALACDMRIITDRASFAQPEINLGLLPGAGGSQRLPRLIGKGKAMEVILTGKPLKAQDAYKWGLANYMVAPEVLDETLLKLCRSITEKSPLMVKWSKECVNLALDCDIESGCDIELDRFCNAFSTQDSKEGTSAFLEKRKPNFIGK